MTGLEASCFTMKVPVRREDPIEVSSIIYRGGAGSSLCVPGDFTTAISDAILERGGRARYAIVSGSLVAGKPMFMSEDCS